MTVQIVQPAPPTRKGRQFVELFFENIAGSLNIDVMPGYQKGIPQHWRVLEMLMSCSTSAVAGNRELKMVKYVETNNDGKYGTSTGITGYKTPTIPANTSKSFQVCDMYFDDAGAFSIPLLNYAQNIGPWALPLCGFDRLHCYLNNPQTGDTWTLRVTLQYLNRLLGMEVIN